MASSMHPIRWFCATTDTHGVKFLVAEDRKPLHKASWAVLITGALMFLAYFFYVRITDFLEFKVTTKVSVSREVVHIPSVRLCMDEHLILDATKLTANDIVNARDPNDGSMSLSNEAFIERNGQKYLSDHALKSFKEFLNGSLNEIDGLSGAVEEMNRNVLLQSLIDYGPDTPLQSPNTYNYSEVVLRARSDYSKSVEVCHAFHSGFVDHDCRDNWSGRSIFNRICLAIDFEDSTEALGNSFLRQTLPKTTAGFMQSARVQRKTEIRRLGARFGNCSTEIGYARSGCFNKCMANTYLKKYRCLGPGMEIVIGHSSTVPLCSEKINRTEFWALSAACILSGCVSPCAEDLFVASVNTMSKYNMHEDTISIEVFSDDATEVVRVDDVELYPLTSLMGELGGTMGLFIGISVLSVAHLIEFIMCCMCGFLMRKKRSNIAKST